MGCTVWLIAQCSDCGGLITCTSFAKICKFGWNRIESTQFLRDTLFAFHGKILIPMVNEHKVLVCSGKGFRKYHLESGGHFCLVFGVVWQTNCPNQFSNSSNSNWLRHCLTQFQFFSGGYCTINQHLRLNVSQSRYYFPAIKSHEAPGDYTFPEGIAITLIIHDVRRISSLSQYRCDTLDLHVSKNWCFIEI